MAKLITVSADGRVYTLEEKNKEILAKISDTIERQKENKHAMMVSKKAGTMKYGAVINNKLLQLFREYGLMTEAELEKIEASDLQNYYIGFLDLINQISVDIEITPTKPLFCAYMGITTKIFNKFAKSEDPEIIRWLDAINGDFTHSIFDSSLQGNASEKVALAFASTKDYGQEVVQNNFAATFVPNQDADYTPKQALEYAENIMKLIQATQKDK